MPLAIFNSINDIPIFYSAAIRFAQLSERGHGIGGNPASNGSLTKDGQIIAQTADHRAPKEAICLRHLFAYDQLERLSRDGGVLRLCESSAVGPQRYCERWRMFRLRSFWSIFMMFHRLFLPKMQLWGNYRYVLPEVSRASRTS